MQGMLYGVWIIYIYIYIYIYIILYYIIYLITISLIKQNLEIDSQTKEI